MITPFGRARQRRTPIPSRLSALNWMVDLLVQAAGEAPTRSSGQWLRDAGASVCNAISEERRFAEGLEAANDA